MMSGDWFGRWLFIVFCMFVSAEAADFTAIAAEACCDSNTCDQYSNSHTHENAWNEFQTEENFFIIIFFLFNLRHLLIQIDFDILTRDLNCFILFILGW